MQYNIKSRYMLLYYLDLLMQTLSTFQMGFQYNGNDLWT